MEQGRSGMNRNFPVHYSEIDGADLRSLEAGETVSFEIGPPQAAGPSGP